VFSRPARPAFRIAALQCLAQGRMRREQRDEILYDGRVGNLSRGGNGSRTWQDRKREDDGRHE
jgi:hypothetical protein